MGKTSKRKKIISEVQPKYAGGFRSSKGPDAQQIRRKFQQLTSKTKLALSMFLILLLSFAVYFNSLSNSFVHDDAIQVLENPWITNIKYIPEIFSKNVWGFRAGSATTNYYRPLMHITYMLDYYIFGLNPRAFHLVNILFHAGVSILVFIIVLRLLGESQPSATSTYLIPSFTATMLFITHPIHTEAVTWIAGLPDVSFTFFYFLSFYLYIRSGTELTSIYFYSVASFFLAALCKEPALTLPVILIAYDYAVKRSDVRFSIQVKRYIPYLIAAGVYFILRFHALGYFAPMKRHAELSIYQYVINSFPLFMKYLQKLILPINLNAFYVLHPIYSLSEAKGILSLMITAAFVAVTLFSLKKNRLIFLSLFFVIVPLLPVLYIPVLGENSFTERYLYLPSFGFVFLFALLLTWAKVNRPKVAVILIAISTIVIGLYSLETIRRNTIWKDNFTFFTDTVRKSPDADIPRYNFGITLQKMGRIDEAIEQWQSALKLNPGYEKAHYNLGLAYFNKGWIDRAIEHLRIALKLNPDDADAHYGLGLAFFNKGMIDEAIKQWQSASELNPTDTEARKNLAIVFLSKGQVDEAIGQWQFVLKQNPDDAEASKNLAIAYELKTKIPKGIRQK